MLDQTAVWQCPSCQTPLNFENKQWRCLHNHCFDSAKEGYVNLLLAQNKKSKAPGDSNDMINARRVFLEKGYYQPLAQKIAEILISDVSLEDTYAVFDAGCGEGYYLNYVAQNLQQHGLRCSFQGVDISKPAIQKAAKRYKDYQFAVASTFDLPISDHSQNAVFQIFAPSSAQEVSRVLVENGLWITVNPAPNHLQELKALVYDAPEQHDISTEVPAGFIGEHHENLTFTFQLEDPIARESLLMMTPFYWRISEQKKAEVLNTLEAVTADFDIRVYRPSSANELKGSTGSN